MIFSLYYTKKGPDFMIIKSIKLENYRRFESLFLEFPENLIGIIGRNGSGKSTLIEAIGWVLYGNRLGRSDKHDIRSQYAEEKSPCSVEMIFNYGGHEYKIIRTLKGTNAISEAAIYRDGGSEPDAVQDRGVNDFIRELLQLDYIAFTTSVFARQKDLDRLSTLQPEERRLNINRLIGIDKIDSARSQVRRDKNNKQQFLDGKTSSLKDLDELQQQFKTLEAVKSKHQGIVEDLEKEVNDKDQALQEAKTAFERQNGLRDQFLALGAKLGKIQTSLEENRKMETRHIKDRQNAKEAATRYKTMASKLETLAEIKAQKLAMDRDEVNDSSRQSKERELARLRDTLGKEKDREDEYNRQAFKLAEIQSRLATLQEQEKQNDSQRKELQEKLNKTRGTMQSIALEGEKEKQKLDGLHDIGPDGECPTCTQRLGEHYESVTTKMSVHIEALRGEYRQLQQQEREKLQEIEKIESLLVEYRRERESLLRDERVAQEAGKTLERINEAVENYKQQIDLVSKELAALGHSEYSREQHRALNTQYEELLELKNQAARVEEQMKRLPQIEQDLNVTRENLDRLNKESLTLRDKQSSLKFVESVFIKARDQVEEKNTQLNKARDEWSSAREQLATTVTELKALDKEIAGQKQARQEIEKARVEIHYLAALDEHFGGFRTMLANRVRPLIANRASELLSLTTHSRYTLLELDQDYNIQIYDGTEAFPIQRFSGGEQDLANLCLRIAISQIVAERSGGSPINFIVLDEIFGSQDSERRDLILNALGRLSEQFRQVFLITHIEPIKDMLPVIIEVEADELSSSAVLV